MKNLLVLLMGLYRNGYYGIIFLVVAIAFGIGLLWAGVSAFDMLKKEERENVRTAVKVSVISGGVAFLILPFILGVVGLVAGVWAGIQGNRAAWIGVGMSLFSLVSGVIFTAMLA